MCVWKTTSPIHTFLALVTLLAAGGCTVEVIPADPGSSSGSPGGSPPAPPTTITVRIVNQTAKPLDPEIYAGPVSAGLNALFDPANQQTAFGVGGVGVMLGLSEASFPVPCTDPVLIATKGGAYGDNLADPIARGRQIVLEQGLNMECGDLIVFTFRASGEALITSVSVSPRD